MPEPPPAGAPLSPLALVSRPAPLPGVQSWSIDTRAHRGPVSWVVYSKDSRRTERIPVNIKATFEHAASGWLIKSMH